MNAIPVLGIPHYNRPDLTARCIASIDYPVEQMVVVMQGSENLESVILTQSRTIRLCQTKVVSQIPYSVQTAVFDLGKIPDCIKEVVTIRHPNAGVAGAWNEIIKLFPGASGTGHHWWLISNNDIAFAPGDLEKMAAEVEAQLALNRVGMFYGNHGASWFGLTAGAVALAGLFDENIFPAYLEDCDYARRCDLLGVPRVTVPGCTARHGDDQLTGSCTVNSDPQLAAQNSRTHGRNFEYYRAKWGGNNGEETFSTPFNDPHWPIDFWRFDPVFRAQQKFG